MPDLATQVCARCGQYGPDNARFCNNCGNPLPGPVKLLEPVRRFGYVILFLVSLTVIVVLLNYKSPTHTVTPDAAQPSTPASGSEADQPASIPPTDSVPTLAVPLTGTEAISVDSSTLLSEYQADEKDANIRYADRKVAITGVLTGVFIPSIEQSMRMSAKGYHASAFVTMGGLRPISPAQTVLLPGITAYSEDRSLFGLEATDDAVGHLNTGESVTLVCVCGRGTLVTSPFYSVSGYSVIMQNCVLQEDSTHGDPSERPAQTLP